MQPLTLSLLLLLLPLTLPAQEEIETIPDSNGVYRVVEEMPRFPGCESPDMTLEEKQACSNQKFLEFIYTRVKYPAIARENGIDGTVLIGFVVEPDGSLTNIRILRDIGGGCGEEARRVAELMSAMPERWTPGKVGGEAVRVHFNFPLKFKLEGGGKKKKKERKKRG